MAKFCGNCGCKLEDNARVCGNCGVPCAKIASHSLVQEIPGVDYISPEKKEKRKRTAKLLIGILILAVVIIAVVNIALARTGYKGAVRKIMNAYRDYDINTLIDMADGIHYDDSAPEYFESVVENGLSTFETEIGHSYKFNYEITEAYELPEYQRNELMKMMEEEHPDSDLESVQKIMVAEVEATAQAKKGEGTSTIHLQICLGKKDGAWRLLSIIEY